MPKREDGRVDTAFWILSTLVGRPKHGAAIIDEVETGTQGKVRLTVSNLYTALKRLMEQGLVERAEDVVEDDERIKAYRLTGAGERALRAELERLELIERQAARVREAWTRGQA